MTEILTKSESMRCWWCDTDRQPIWVDDTNGKFICPHCDQLQQEDLDDYWFDPNYEDD